MQTLHKDYNCSKQTSCSAKNPPLNLRSENGVVANKIFLQKVRPISCKQDVILLPKCVCVWGVNATNLVHTYAICQCCAWCRPLKSVQQSEIAVLNMHQLKARDNRRKMKADWLWQLRWSWHGLRDHSIMTPILVPAPKFLFIYQILPTTAFWQSEPSTLGGKGLTR